MPHKSASGHPKRILILGEELSFSGLLALTLREAGYQVAHASDAETATQAVTTAVADLAVCDIGTQASLCIELIRLPRDELRIPFVFFSEKRDPESVRQAAILRGLAYLSWPVDLRDCLPTIQLALAHADELRRLRETTDQLSAALGQSRAASMAIGVLMERFRLNRDDAMAALRDRARSQRRRATEIAEAILDAVESLDGAARKELRPPQRHP